MHDAINWTSLMRDKATFSDKINQLLDNLAIDCSALTLDHIAIRTHDKALTLRLADDLAEQGTLISQASVNGRPIHIYQLKAPIKLGGWQTALIELPFPSQKRYEQQGWEHVEFVVPCFAATMAELEKALTTHFPGLLARAACIETVKIKRSEPRASGERLANPTIAFKENGVCVKFHPFSLSDIIASEASV
ncbi:VOC family protein [Salinivibrio sp. ES.052]|uniref:VOC family protein n=1 Tax=Salinivibrio sp. ES.052 TaxID=1882823 RepID=UPI000927FEC6|nr:VOC family protein [Salinivibrio sp. ES.052]SIN93875.1 hypothetical protein SAMN05444724_1301 [Salinivibrio sp. ES.052]